MLSTAILPNMWYNQWEEGKLSMPQNLASTSDTPPFPGGQLTSTQFEFESSGSSIQFLLPCMLHGAEDRTLKMGVNRFK